MKKTQNSKQSFTQNVYLTLVSMKFAIIIMILLGATSLLSMLINEYPDFFSKNSVLNSLFQQHSPYSSWWYSILLWFLIISVLLCVIKNLRPTLKSILTLKFLSGSEIRSIHDSKQVSLRKSLDFNNVKKILKRNFYSISESSNDTEQLLVARKFRWSSLGHLLTHISLLVIVLGSLIYTKTDRKEFRYVIAEEFKETEFFETLPDLFQWHFKVNDLDHPTMVVDSFRVRYYTDSHGPSISDFRSYVRLFDHDGNLLAKHEITVNSPLIYKHVSIHQSDYKPLVNEFFMNIPNRNQVVGRLQQEQEFNKNETNWITGLSLRANKGKSVIFAGMSISVIGLILSFMFWPRYIWLALDNKKITIGGRSPKNKIAFSRELDNIIKRISDE